MNILAPSPAPEPQPPTAAELKAWALSIIQAPANTPEDLKLRFVLNDLVTQLDAEVAVAAALTGSEVTR